MRCWILGAALLVSAELRADGPRFIRGDTNQDGAFDVSDPIRVLLGLFTPLGATDCAAAEDMNGDGTVDLSDAVFGLAALFGSGVVPAAPFPECGEEPAQGGAGCTRHAPCTEESALRYASGWPDAEITAGRPEMDSWSEYPIATGWAVTGVWVRVEERTLVTRVAGVGLSDRGTSPASDFRARLAVHSSAEAFAASPREGDVYQEGDLWHETNPLLVRESGPRSTWTYYVSLGFEPFELVPGTYILSVWADRVGPGWWWSESALDLGSDITADFTNPGEWFEYRSHPDFSTGTAALDVFGERL